MKILILISCFLMVFSNDYELGLSERFRFFKNNFAKKFKSPVLEKIRKNIFIDRYEKIKQQNENYLNGKSLYSMRVNKFTDMLYSEVVKKYTGLLVENDKKTKKNKPRSLSNVDFQIPLDIDYRLKNMVTQVKDQGECGSCWAFAATGVLEAQHAKKTGTLLSFSEQMLIDCTLRPFGNNGCNGGRMENAFLYTNLRGIMRDQDYPYNGTINICRFNSKRIVNKTKLPIRIPSDENEIKLIVAREGPVAIGINISPNFINYDRGIFTGDDCTDDVNHAVLIVGYGRENGVDFWIIKNSWNVDWGENGYIRMLMGKRICGITMIQSYTKF